MNRPDAAAPPGRLSSIGLVVMMATLLLSACENLPPTGQAQADAETRAACQARAEQAYTQQNRAQIFAPQTQVNSPFSANYNPDSNNRGLSDLFVHDRMVNDCIRNTGSNSDRGVPLPPPPRQ